MCEPSPQPDSSQGCGSDLTAIPSAMLGTGATKCRVWGETLPSLRAVSSAPATRFWLVRSERQRGGPPRCSGSCPRLDISARAETTRGRGQFPQPVTGWGTHTLSLVVSPTSSFRVRNKHLESSYIIGSIQPALNNVPLSLRNRMGMLSK